MHSRRARDGTDSGVSKETDPIWRTKEEPEDVHISLSRLDYKTGQPRPGQAERQPPSRADDVVDDMERRCIAAAKNGKRDNPRHPGPSQKEGALHLEKQID